MCTDRFDRCVELELTHSLGTVINLKLATPRHGRSLGQRTGVVLTLQKSLCKAKNLSLNLGNQADAFDDFLPGGKQGAAG